LSDEEDYAEERERQRIERHIERQHDILSDNEPPKSGCFIATAAFGTPLANEIGILREFRDNRLLGSTHGLHLVRIYYRVSPPIANLVARIGFLRRLIRLLIRCIVAQLLSHDS
jgi:hypothetical protein